MKYVVIDSKGRYLTHRKGGWEWTTKAASAFGLASRACADQLAAALGASVELARDERRPLPM